jgi:hypothetical protein
VPSEVGAALRALAEARGATVSTVVTDAIEREIRLAALDGALAEADRRFGALAEEQIARAEAEFFRATASARSRRGRAR